MVGISFASILIRLAEAPALVVAFYRMAIAAALVWSVTLLSHSADLKQLRGRPLLLSLISGVFVAAHFGTWITSLGYTSVASSVVLVATQPLFVALISHFFLGERISALTAWGILAAVVGGAVIGFGDFAEGSNILMGDVLALVGAIMAAGYLLIGRRVRASVSLLPYVSVVYGAASLVLLLSVLVSGQTLVGYVPRTYLMMFLVAVVPQVVGHSSLNWALGYLSAAFVAISILGEPVGATLWASIILQEPPTIAEVVGGVAVLAGIYLAVKGERYRLKRGEPSKSPTATDL